MIGKINFFCIALAALFLMTTCSLEDGAMKELREKTKAAKIHVSGVSLNRNTLALGIGGSETLVATVTPADAWEKSVTWGSGNMAVATVDNNGKVTALAAGTAAVTVTSADGGKTAQCTVVVIEMVWIAAGTFTMGSPTTEPGRWDDETQHQVTLSAGFYMGKYQVTQDQWATVMAGNTNGISTAPSYFSSNPAAGEVQGRRPVECVSWYDALVFCNRLSMQEGLSPAYSISGSTNPNNWGTVSTDWNVTRDAVTIVSGSNGYRLPTEAQWEYACRAGTTTAYNTGEAISDNTGWYAANSGSMTHEVGKSQRTRGACTI